MDAACRPRTTGHPIAPAISLRWPDTDVRLAPVDADVRANAVFLLGDTPATAVGAELRGTCLPRGFGSQATSQPWRGMAPEIQHLTSLVKMFTYQAESDLLRIVAPHYDRADDGGRMLIRSALASAADLEVSATEVRVALAPLSSSRRTRALAALCETQNPSEVRFPDSSLRLR